MRESLGQEPRWNAGRRAHPAGCAPQRKLRRLRKLRLTAFRILLFLFVRDVNAEARSSRKPVPPPVLFRHRSRLCQEGAIEPSHKTRALKKRRENGILFSPPPPSGGGGPSCAAGSSPLPAFAGRDDGAPRENEGACPMETSHLGRTAETKVAQSKPRKQQKSASGARGERKLFAGCSRSP